MQHLRLLAGLLLATGGWAGAANLADSGLAEWRVDLTTNAVGTVREDWFDSNRSRKVPVKIYFPQASAAPLPIIIFSHGLGGSRDGYGYLGQFWASHGYVVVHLQHSGSDEAVWKDAGLGRRMSAMRHAAAQPQNARDRTQDVSFAIDELTRLQEVNSIWRGKLDLHRLGVAGHSFGAHTTLTVAGAVYSRWSDATAADWRVRAVIPMSAPVPANKSLLDVAYAGVKIPALHLTGTEDDSPIGDTKASERRLPFDHSHHSDQFLITFTGGDHAIFGGRERRIGGAKDGEFQRLICQSSLAFWDAYLRDDALAQDWLTTKCQAALGPAAVFEVKLKP